MKILIHSNAPWVPSGYGVQTAMALRQLTDLGHEVAVSAFWGLRGGVVQWGGHTIYPGGKAEYGQDVMIPHADHFGADLIITLMDFWKFAPAAGMLRQYLDASKDKTRLAAWLPIDCTPMSHGDKATLTGSGAIPIAMSVFGQRELERAGFDAHYIPHSVDLGVFKPCTAADRAAVRKEFGLTEQFVVGLNAANKDAIRKAFPEQFQAFAELTQLRSDAVLLVHADAYSPGGHRLDVMAQDMGISDRVVFTDEYPQVSGILEPQDMANWYNACDVVTNCSYAEGFGLAILEAQACGVPVAATDGSAMRELVADELMQLVDGEAFWNPYHRGWWKRPTVLDIMETIQGLGRDGGASIDLVSQAACYGVDRVRDAYWAPFLESLS